MVESPTYFNSLYPVLKSLTNTNIEDFKLYEQIVLAKPEERRLEISPYRYQEILAGKLSLY